VTMILRSSLLVYLQTRMDSIIMSRFLEHLLYLPLSFFQKRSSGDILSRLESNTVVRDTVSNHIVSSVLDGGCVLLYLIILFSLSPTLGFWLLLIEVVQTVVMVGSDRYMDGLNERELEETGKTQGYTSEVLSGIATLKAAGAEQRALRKWSHLFTAQIRSSIRRGYFSSAIESFTDVLQELTPIVILWIGAGQVLNGSLDLGTMLALSALAATFMTALTSLVKSVQEIQVVKSHLGRIADVMNAEREQDMQQVKSPPRLTGRIRLEQANFKYDESSERVLKNINVAIEPGQKIAIVGRSGSGKSTLGKLLLGLYTPTSGGVYYDEMSLQSLHYQEVRAQFGVVIQDVRIFSGTIRENIALNFPDITLEEITSSAVLADLHNDIMKMPMGYETYVSEGGNGLSGGQQQRLALARALAHRPAILLLDEATSALDVVTERQVERNLSTLSCTKIVITHRLSSIRDADRILVVDDGWLVEQGTHQNLLARNGFYANLLRQQLENGEIRGDI
jgi:ATP-binding cassette subfamily B protein